MSSTVAADVNIELRAECEKRTVGQTVHVGIYVVSDDDTVQLLSATQVIFGWNPAELTLIGVDPPDPDLVQSSGFPDDPFGINEAIPPADGDGIYIALAQLDAGGPIPIPATPDGTLLNTLEFVAIAPALPATIAVLASAGTPPTSSIVFDDEIPNFDITGLLIPATVEINPLPYCPADIFPPDAPDRVVGPGDLGQLLANWGKCETYDPICPDNVNCPADLFPPGNPDGVVGPGDLGQLLANWGECPVCGNAGAGNCFEADGTPGCDNAACCEAVCAVDPFCCDVSWDTICAGEAADLCEGCGDPDAGSCCEANGTPYCDDRACCTAICAFDPFCCDVEWDGICADEAADNAACDCKPAAVCDLGNPNECCTAGSGPGCSNPACCEAICAIDPFCCDVEWDSICAGEAADEPSCGCDVGDPACGKGAGDCCVANGTPGCEDVDCCNAVCAIDAFCCDVSWDSICADEAAAEPLCGCAPETNDACADRFDIFNGTTKFSNVGATTDGPSPCGGLGSDIWYNYIAECTGTVTIDTFGSSFDTVLAAYDGCDCPSAPASNCCVAHAGTGCDDDACETTVCTADSFCCNTAWDSICADEAADLCGDLCATGGSPLLACNDDSGGLQSSITISVVQGNCYKLQVGGFNGLQGTGVITVTKNEDCVAGDPACGPGAGDCCVANGTPGCDDATCCNSVCAADPFCCDTSWDSICAGEAAADPNCSCGDPKNPACGKGAGDCCVANGTPGCDDVDCCNAVCAIDPFCCNNSWDSICAGEAADEALCGCGP